jgi:hypothetical protein
MPVRRKLSATAKRERQHPQARLPGELIYRQPQGKETDRLLYLTKLKSPFKGYGIGEK